MLTYYHKIKNKLANNSKRGLWILIGLCMLLAPAGITHAATDPYCTYLTKFNKTPAGCYPTLAVCLTNKPTLYTCTLQSVQETTNGGTGTIFERAGKLVGNKMVEVLGDIAGAIIEGIAHLFFKGAGIFMTIMGDVLDTSIIFTVQSEVYKNVGAIQVGWTAVRDFSNMFFIFVLLYIAILTVLGMAGSNAKRWVAHLVIAALLINFSLFATQVVVDAGNILAVGFWDKMSMSVTTSTGTVTRSTAAAWFMEGFRIQTTADTSKDALDPTGKPIESGHTKNILIYIGGGTVYLVAGYVFLAGAVMMIVRSVTLMILMIASPFAFLGFALPKGGGFASQWLNKLIGSTFVAPVFIFMLYIDSLIIRGTTLAGSEWTKLSGAGEAKIALALQGSAANFPIIYNFILMVILLLASLKVADAVSSGAGSKAGDWAKRRIGGGVAATAALGGSLYRNTSGRYAAKQLENKELHHLATQDNAAGEKTRRQIAAYTRTANSTGDLRSTGIGKGITSLLAKTGVDTGGPNAKTFSERTKAGGQYGSYVGARDNAKKDDGGFGKAVGEQAVADEAKKMFPDNPEAQKHYIESKLGKKWTDTERNKKAKDALDTVASKKAAERENKEEFGNAIRDGAAGNTKLEQLNKQKDDLEKRGLVADAKLIKEIDDTAKNLEPINDRVKQAMLRMTGEDVAKLMDKKDEKTGALYRDSAAVRSNLSSKDYTAINKSYMEGKYKESMGNNDKQMMAELTTEALKSEKTPDATKRMIKNSMKNGTWGHEIDFKKEIGNHIKSNASDKEFNETWSMLDNEDKADLKEMLLEERIAERLDGSTLGAIGKKGNEGVYDNVHDFRDRLQDLHSRGVLGRKSARNGRNTAAAHIDKNFKKQESYFYDMTPTQQAANTGNTGSGGQTGGAAGGNTGGGGSTGGNNSGGGNAGGGNRRGGSGGGAGGSGAGGQPQPTPSGNSGGGAGAAANPVPPTPSTPATAPRPTSQPVNPINTSPRTQPTSAGPQMNNPQQQQQARAGGAQATPVLPVAPTPANTEDSATMSDVLDSLVLNPEKDNQS